MDVATSKGEVIFVAVQPDIDTWLMPTSSDGISITGTPEFTQPPVVAENEESIDSFSDLPGQFVGYNAGQLKISTNFKVHGSPGELPPIHPLLLSSFGRHTVNAVTDVRYKHYRKGTDPFVYLSIIWKRALTVEYITGAFTNIIELPVSGKKIPQLNFTGTFKKKVVAGRGYLKEAIDGTSTAVTVIEFRDPEQFKNFDIGSLVVVGTDDNSGTGHEVTAVDDTNNTITLKDGVTTAQAADVLIKGFAPTFTRSGVDVKSRFGWITIDTGSGARDVAITETKYQSDNGTKPLDDLMYKEDFTSEIVGDTRKVTLSNTKYLGITDLGSRWDIKNQTDIPITLNLGNEPGATVEIVIPKARLKDDKESGSPEIKKTLDLQCFPDTGDDESEMIIK